MIEDMKNMMSDLNSKFNELDDKIDNVADDLKNIQESNKKKKSVEKKETKEEVKETNSERKGVGNKCITKYYRPRKKIKKVDWLIFSLYFGKSLEKSHNSEIFSDIVLGNVY